MQSSETRLRIPKPFSLKATALSHGWHECAPMSWCEGGKCLQTIERFGDMPVRVSLTEASSRGRRATVRVVAEAEEMNDSLLTLMRERTAVMLRARLDLSGFNDLIESHATLSVLPRIGAGRTLRAASMTENIIKAMCATNVNWTQAVKMINRICQLGPCLKHFRNLNAWPTPSEILSAGPEYLNNVARQGYRTESILAFCRSVRDGDFDPESLDAPANEATTDELYHKLVSIRGIGPSSANFLLGLVGRFDRMSIDSATLAFVARTYTNGRKPSVKEVERMYERYGAWRNLVCWFEGWTEWETARSMVRAAPGD